MDKRNVHVGVLALTVVFLTISLTAFGEPPEVKRDHETVPGATAPTTPPTGVSGAIPAGTATATATASPQPSPGTAAATDPARIRQFQLKAILTAAVKDKPAEEQKKLFTALAVPPANAAQAAAQKQLARDLINGLPKELLTDEVRAQVAASTESLFGNTPATAEELRLAAFELTNPVVNDLAKAQAGAVAAAGATTDPTKVADPAKGGDPKAADPKAAAVAEKDKALADINKQIAAAQSKLGSINAGLGENAKGNEKAGENAATPPSSSTPSSSTPPTDPSASQAKNNSKNDSKPSESNNAKNNSDTKKEKDLPPLFGSNDSSKDSKKEAAAEPKETPSFVDNSIDLGKKDEKPAAKKELTKKDKEKLESPDASAFGEPPGGFGGALPPVAKSEVPPGESSVPQSIAPSDGSPIDLGGGDSGGGDGGLGSTPVAGGGGGAGSGAGGDFPNVTGGDSGYGGGGAGGGGKMSYNYTKGLDVYKGGGGGGGAGGGGDSGDEATVDGGGAGEETPTLANNASMYSKRLAAVASQIIVVPSAKAAAAVAMSIASRPSVFAMTAVARNYLTPRGKGSAPTAASVAKLRKRINPPVETLVLGNVKSLSGREASVTR